MQVKNDYDILLHNRKGDFVSKGVYNGEIGAVFSIRSGIIIVNFDGRFAEYPLENLGELELSYASTIHKSQGSEYNTVIIPLLPGHKILLSRNLFYTAVTRAKQRVILVGHKKALYMAIRKNATGKRNTTPRDLTCNEDIQLMLLLLAESVASRMRDLASRCTVVEVSVRDTELRSFSRQRTLAAPTCSSTEIAETAFALFQANYAWEKPVRSIGVRGAGLVEAGSSLQLSLYADAVRRDKWERIDAAVDDLQGRYGYMSVRRALLLTDPVLGNINPKDNHTVHPAGCFWR